MKTVERNVVRLAVVQHLRAAYGIKMKNWNKGKTNSNKTTGNSVKVFGVALESLPHCYVLDYGDIPCFLVDACTYLMGHLDTEGLFRKSGSIVRMKALRAKLEKAEECLSTALPLDIAGLLKQFFRDLPEPVLPADLHGAFLKAQELPTVEEKTSATVLLSCVLPHENMIVLRYFLSFLKRVSLRCVENKMDSSNLSVIFSPNFLHCGDGTEKMNASTEKRLKLQAAVVQFLIDNAQNLGAVPEFLLAKVPAMLGCETGVFSPSDALEEGSASSGVKRSRRSLGDMVNGALNKFKSSRTPSNTPQSDGTVHSTGTPVVMTPKRKLPAESSQSYGFSNKKHRSIKKNLGLELFPSTLFGGPSTPESVHSASGSLDSQSALSSVGRSSRLSASSAKRKSKRLNHRNIGRVESGKAGCFSPRVTKKEATRKSLRLRFSLGKTNRDCSVISHSLPVPKGSEVIGWRLATQESVTSFHFTKDTVFNPAILKNSSTSSKGSKYISKSEDNLLTPCKTTESWSVETPNGNLFPDTPMNVYLKTNYRSEPSIVVSKPLIVGSIPKGFCCATSAESLACSESCSEENTQTLVKMRSYEESSSTLLATDKDNKEEPKEKKEHTCVNIISESYKFFVASESSSQLKESGSLHMPQKDLVDNCNDTFKQFEIGPLSPLHIDSALFEHEAADNSVLAKNTQESFPVAENESSSLFMDGSTGPTGSRLVDALDIQSPMAFKLMSAITVQSTPLAARERIEELDISQHEFIGPLLLNKFPEQHGGPIHNEQECTRGSIEPGRVKVADHVQRFNMLTLASPKPRVARSPLKFQRTPVRQSVRRINSLGQRKETRSGWCAASQGTPVVKAVSLESGLCTGTPQLPQAKDVSHCPPHDKGVFLKPKLPVPPKKPSTCHGIRHWALEDVTNTVAPKLRGSMPSDVQQSSLLQPAERDMSHYRGSPKNPLTQCKLLSAMKPLDL
ncbi:rho GTPase-activating protein 11A isoform X1 [Electrophorus electricus]|uniref:Rho-GAP domain-containing protein n=1 Tax=Electrophorus electricus TaxID=8005 RepID=A0A4W4HCN1_ELEEL|nr:rho GTPase-activating protein 11A isoform X1 [Electrophorus electricus]